MLGFIKKDLLMIKSNFKIIAILLIIYVIMGFMGEMDISFILPFISVMLMISTFSYDNYNNWDSYAITLPNGRKNSVKAKYITTIILILTVSIITTILSILISYYKLNIVDFKLTIFNMTSIVFGTMLVLMFMYPMIYKLGVEKARIGIFIMVFGIIILGSILLQYININKILNSLSLLENYFLILIRLIIIILLYISYKISLRIYLKKEF